MSLLLCSAAAALFTEVRPAGRPRESQPHATNSPPSTCASRLPGWAPFVIYKGQCAVLLVCRLTLFKG